MFDLILHTLGLCPDSLSHPSLLALAALVPAIFAWFASARHACCNCAACIYRKFLRAGGGVSSGLK
jgi:hypothetical protein